MLYFGVVRWQAILKMKKKLRLNDNLSKLYSDVKSVRHRAVVLRSVYSKISLSCVGYFLLSPLSYAALSAITANEIQGTAPYLLLADNLTKLDDLNQLLSFEMPNRDGSTGTEIIDEKMAGSTLIAPQNMTFNQVKTMIVADGQLHDLNDLKVGSDDGDAIHAANTRIDGQMKATWYNGLSQKITNLNQTLTSCGGPYILTIEIPTEVSANTSFGFPHHASYGIHSGVSYTFTSSNQGVCYLKPYNMTTYNGVEGQTVKYAKGYNPDLWEVNKGFKVSANFPTTGFYKASFSLIGSGNDQRKYRCTSKDHDGKIILSGNASIALGLNCTVTYNSTTRAEFISGGTPTINLEYDRGSGDWVKMDSYTIPVPTSWALGSGSVIYSNQGNLSTSTSFKVLDTCRLLVDGTSSPATTVEQAIDLTDEGKAWRQKYLYRRDELTNTPYADRSNYPEGSSPAYGGYFSRDVDGSFMGEWGYVNTYSGSVWATNGYYWTAELWSLANQVEVHTNGYVHNIPPYSSGYIAICRG